MQDLFKSIVVILLLATPAICQQAANAGLEGTIVKFGTGEPVSKVRLELQGGAETVATTTETDGKFYFPNLQPGTYRLLARRDGYWRRNMARDGSTVPDSPSRSLPVKRFPTSGLS